MSKKNIKYLLIAFGIVSCGLLWFMLEKNQGVTENTSGTMFELTEGTSNEAKELTEEVHSVYVHIVGAVKKPGVYTFQEKPRVIDVIEAAGGFTKQAVRSDINQAEVVEDGVQIVIASKAEKKKKESDSNKEMIDVVDLNNATKEQLMTLPGIGESKAEAILSYRETNGSFQSVEDIMNITGIKNGVFDKIKDKIRV